MTPAIDQLKQHQLSFSILEYTHDPSNQSFGDEAVTALGLDANCVFKTLVVQDHNKQLAVALVPVSARLNMKKLAKTLAVKKVEMADKLLVQRSTGYVLGGVSPLGQKRRLPTVIDSSAIAFNEVYVSAGKRGLELALCPKILQQQTNAQFASIV